MKKAFVTGGAGHVGGNLVRQLLSDGWDVRCLIHKDTRALDGLSVVRVQGSITSADILSDQMSGCVVVCWCGWCLWMCCRWRGCPGWTVSGASRTRRGSRANRRKSASRARTTVGGRSRGYFSRIIIRPGLRGKGRTSGWRC